jgi:hypothetical protein
MRWLLFEVVFRDVSQAVGPESGKARGEAYGTARDPCATKRMSKGGILAREFVLGLGRGLGLFACRFEHGRALRSAVARAGHERPPAR